MMVGIMKHILAGKKETVKVFFKMEGRDILVCLFFDN